MISRYALHVSVCLWVLPIPGLAQDTLTPHTVIDSDQAVVSFLEHRFLCSYEIYRTGSSKGIKYLYQISNLSEFEDKAIRWNSANMDLPGMQRGEVGKPISSDIRYDVSLAPELFDAYRHVGLNGIEVDRILPGEIMTFALESAPCYLPYVDTSWMFFKYGYPPYRWIYDFFKNPFGIVQRFSDGKIEIRFSSSVAYVDDGFLYTYSVETDSLEPVFFQWLSTASEDPERLDGVIGEVVGGKPFKRNFRSSKGPEVVLDVAATNTKGFDALPLKFLERLPGPSRVQARFLGGSLNQEGRVGIKDVPPESRESNSFFLAPSIVVQGSDASVSLRTPSVSLRTQ